ncbi:hypothetical protein J2T22_001208 [Pseudarthrobacter defluvii]|uniref:Uncharacterized protein n=1 Tax=Pseudarthrobacter defluvii TaxID=410837 RepID=A0ABT9UG88_9MICC|nr:hypothetical protein [Pseudarthrobacter defluvii]MDQ0118031.1 hypothetical protein [Pseudarthrobacter defluvii]
MDTFLNLFEEVTHDGFMVGVAVLTTLTLVILGIAIRRILPKHKQDATLPPRGATK